MRVSSNKKVVPSAATPNNALEVLRSLTNLDGHEFWVDDCRLREPPFPLSRLGAYRQVTDLHLAALAARNNGTLATFDRGIADVVDTDNRDLVHLIPTG